MSYNTFTYLLCIALSLLTGFMFAPEAPLTKKILFRSLEAMSGPPPQRDGRMIPQVALCCNTNIDRIVDAGQMISALELTISSKDR